MPPRDWSFRVGDILEAIDSIVGYVHGMNYEAFAADRKTVDAVIRNFIVIGEAAAHMPEDICEANPEIPWKDMRDMRNFVVHEYFGVSKPVLWETVHYNLSPLVPLLQAMLNNNE